MENESWLFDKALLSLSNLFDEAFTSLGSFYECEVLDSNLWTSFDYDGDTTGRNARGSDWEGAEGGY